jgi:hypothetical protein
VKIDRTLNMQSTEMLGVSVRVQPKGYARFITTDIGFQSPALKAKVA